MTLPSWRKPTSGGVILEAGNAVDYVTGTWRAEKPVVDLAKCTHCMFCWLFCPDSSVVVADGRFVGFDLDHCKGCGICAVECPPKAIQMVPETQTEAGDTA